MSAAENLPSPSKPVALITGGKGDLAKAVEIELLAQGYDVLAPGREDLDVTSSGSTKAFFNQHGQYDLVICNAGIIRDKMTAKMTAEEFAEVLSVCLDGTWRVAKVAIKSMSRQRRGHLVFIGSFSALSGPAGQANYAAAKAALIGLATSLAREYGQRGIRVNCVLPGFMETKMTAHLSEEVVERVKEAHVLDHFNDTGSVARFIAFLDQHLPHTSGQVFNLDSRIHRWA